MRSDKPDPHQQSHQKKNRPLASPGPIDPKTGERITGRIESEGVQGGQIRRDAEWKRRFKRAGK